MPVLEKGALSVPASAHSHGRREEMDAPVLPRKESASQQKAVEERLVAEDLERRPEAGSEDALVLLDGGVNLRARECTTSASCSRASCPRRREGGRRGTHHLDLLAHVDVVERQLTKVAQLLEALLAPSTTDEPPRALDEEEEAGEEDARGDELDGEREEPLRVTRRDVVLRALVDPEPDDGADCRRGSSGVSAAAQDSLGSRRGSRTHPATRSRTARASDLAQLEEPPPRCTKARGWTQRRCLRRRERALRRWARARSTSWRRA